METLALGFAKVQLRPRGDLPLAGFGRMWSGGTLDDLFVRAMVASDGATTVAVVSCDVLGFYQRTAAAAKRLAATESGIPRENILLAATHTHSAPALILVEPEHMGGPWFDEFRGCVARAVRQARAALEPATLAYARGRCDLGVNRREEIADGITIGQDFGKPTDPELLVARAMAADGRVLGSIVNYACHPVVLGVDNTLVSADYPGVVSRALEVGSEGACLFLTGACGDINPSLDGESWVGRRPEDLQRFGDDLTRRCEELLRGEMTEVSGGAVEVRNETVALALAPEVSEPVAEVAFATEAAALGRLTEETGSAVEARARVAAARDAFRNRKLEHDSMVHPRYGMVVRDGCIVTQLQLIRVGGLMFCALPGEVLTGVGLAVKEVAGGGPCVIATCANDYVAYLPGSEVYAKGGFESWRCILSEAGVREFNDQARRFFG